MNRAFTVTIFVAILLAGAFFLFRSQRPELDFTQYVDDRIESSNKKFERFDAVEYFESGGLYVDTGEDPDEIPYDVPFVLPLIKNLETEFGLDFYILARNSQGDSDQRIGVELIADIPSGVSKEALKESLGQHAKKTSGFILQEWGTSVLSLDFLTEEEARALNLENLEQ